MTANDIVKRMIYMRKSKGWSQSRLSRESGVTIFTIRRIEQGGGWSGKTMDAINTALDEFVFGFA